MSECLSAFYSKTTQQLRAAFFSTFFFGFLAHGTVLFNKFCFHDDAEYLFDVGATYTSGRWMLDIYAKAESFLFADGHYSLPLFNGLISILLIAVAACLIIDLFSIRKTSLCVFIGGFMVSFPVITGLFGYMFTAPAYMVAMLAAVFGAYCVCKFSGWISVCAGTILIGCSIGIYQAFLPLALSLMLLYLITMVIDNHGVSFVILFRKAILYAGCAAASLVFYIVINKFYLTITHAALTSYMGISNMGSGSIREYIERVIFAYKRFFKLLPEWSYNMYPSRIAALYYAAMVVGGILTVVAAAEISRKHFHNVILFLLLVALLPLAGNLIFVLAKPSDVHSLMVYGQIAPFIYLAILLDRRESDSKITWKRFSECIILLLFLMNIMYVRFANQCYLKATFTQQECISYFTTIITQIKSAEGYSDDFPIAVINEKHITDKTLHGAEEFDHINLLPYKDIYSYVNNSRWRYFADRWCGFRPEYADASAFEGLPEVAQMPSYPDCGSICVIDKTVVIKF